jgi:hypothetical protein
MHQKIIFVNGHLFSGTYPGGAGYWLGADSPFVANAHSVLQCELPAHFTDIKHAALSSVFSRMKAGWQYAQKNEASLLSGFESASYRFNFVTHSMGAAFAEGIIRFLEDKEYRVCTVIHFNTFQAADIKIERKAGSKSYVIDYQNINDPLINNPVYAKPGDIRNADLSIRQKSNKPFFKRHRDPIDSEHSWFVIRNFLAESNNAIVGTTVHL